tara:strand:+ start:375 stop:851 length:477 start_codon:yes stop_codon:yes gene_type:complete
MKTTGSSSNQNLKDWILDYLSKPNPVFNDLPPCPFAKKAWLDGNVELKKFVNYEKLEESIKDIVGSKVKVFYFEYPLLPTAEKLKSVVAWLGTKHPQFIFYDEHPDTIEKVGGEVVNSGVTAIIVQDRKDLLEKRAELHKTGYYNKWTPEMKERIFDR